jgi:hypothetical protein
MSKISLTTKDSASPRLFSLLISSSTYEIYRVQKVSSSFPFNQNVIGFEVDHSQYGVQ